MALRDFPLHAEVLLEKLEEEFPPRCIGPNESLADAHRYAGKVALLKYIRDWMESLDRKET